MKCLFCRGQGKKVIKKAEYVYSGKSLCEEHLSHLTGQSRKALRDGKPPKDLGHKIGFLTN